MAPWIKWPVRSDDVTSALNAAITGLKFGREIATISPPARIAISATIALLETLRVRSLLFRDDETLVYVNIGHLVERQGLCQHRAILL